MADEEPRKETTDEKKDDNSEKLKVYTEFLGQDGVDIVKELMPQASDQALMAMLAALVEHMKSSEYFFKPGVIGSKKEMREFRRKDIISFCLKEEFPELQKLTHRQLWYSALFKGKGLRDLVSIYRQSTAINTQDSQRHFKQSWGERVKRRIFG